MSSTTNGRVAVVTGASRGLGFLLAREFADRGYDLVVCARSGEGLEAARGELERGSTRVEAVSADVGVASDAQHVVDAAVRRFGRLDVLVTNAGIIQTGPAAAMSTERYAEAMHVMFWGQLHPVLAALPHLRRCGGRILAITSVGGKVPAPHLLPYVAAKHAAVGLAEGLRVETAREGVSVTVAVPGLMRTGSPRNALFTGDRTAEHAWFTVSDSLPLLSMDAERAARKLVTATLRGRPEIVLTLPAALAVRAHALAPSTTMRLLDGVNRLLPTGDGTRPQPGHAVATRSPVFRALTGLTRMAARRFRQHDDPTPRS